MRVIQRTDAFTLVGADARRGKLTLFAADETRQGGALKHVGVRVPGGGERLEVPDGLVLEVVDAAEGDLDHVALYSADPERAAAEYERLGFRPAGPARVEVGGAHVEFHEGDPGPTEQPLLNHLGLLVDSAQAHRDEAEAVGLEIEDFVDAPNTLALFVRGPEGVKVEYVEHKPSFALT